MGLVWFAIIAKRLQKMLNVGALTSSQTFCTFKCSNHGGDERLIIPSPFSNDWILLVLKSAWRGYCQWSLRPFYAQVWREWKLEGFFTFAYLGMILLTGFRQPSDTYSGQNWGRPWLPRSLQGPRCPSGEKGAGRSSSGLSSVSVNQMFVTFLLVFGVRLSGQSCSLNPLLTVQHILHMLLRNPLHNIH